MGGALVAAVAVAVLVPVLLAGGPPAVPTPGPGTVPARTLPGGSVTALTTPRPTLPGSTPSVASPPPSGSSSPSSSSPSAPSPSTPAAGTVATRVRIERLGIDLPIIEGDGIDAPIGKAAHLPRSGWPGGGTNIYIYGHARDGMFLPLWQVAVGDIVILSLKGGGERSYTVRKVLPRVPWNALSYTAPTDHEILTLQTSTSYYATAPRFVAIAEPTT